MKTVLLYNEKKYMHLRICEEKGMSTELRDLISEVWEYCQEHTTMAMAVGAVLLILLVSVLLVLSAKREETEADSEVADVIEEVPEPEAKDETEVEDESEVEAEPEPEEVDPLEPSVTAARDVVEDILRSVKAASGVSGQKVEAIELKIEKAQLTIHYAGSSKTGSGIPGVGPGSGPGPGGAMYLCVLRNDAS